MNENRPVAGVEERAAQRYAELYGQSKGVLMLAVDLFFVVDAGQIAPSRHRLYLELLDELQQPARR